MNFDKSIVELYFLHIFFMLKIFQDDEKVNRYAINQIFKFQSSYSLKLCIKNEFMNQILNNILSFHKIWRIFYEHIRLCSSYTWCNFKKNVTLLKILLFDLKAHILRIILNTKTWNLKFDQWHNYWFIIILKFHKHVKCN